MPTQTFLNLSPEKREALLSKALEEFATHDYQSASISRISAQAAIAKGSLYQYFADKRDFYLYLVEVASQTLMTAIRHEPPPEPGATIFVLLRWQMSATVRAALRHPLESQLVRRAYGTPGGPLDEALTNQAKAGRDAHLTPLIAEAIARGDIAADLDPELVAHTISGIIADLGPLLIAKLGLDADQAVTGDPAVFATPEVEHIYDTIIRILQHGLANTQPAQ